MFKPNVIHHQTLRINGELLMSSYAIKKIIDHNLMVRLH